MFEAHQDSMTPDPFSPPEKRLATPFERKIEPDEQPVTKSEEKHVGALVGMAVGDAMGMPLEFLTHQQIIEKYHGTVTGFEHPYPNHPNQPLQAGQYTDDTQLALLVVETLLEKRGFEATDYKQRMLAAKRDLRSLGKTTRYALARMEKEETGTGHPESLGCGPLVRGVPLGLWYGATHQEGPALIADAIDAAKVTHSHPLVTTATALVACQIAYLKDQAPHTFRQNDFLDFSYAILEPISLIERRDARDEITPVLDSVAQNLGSTPSRVRRVFSATGSASDVFRIALYSFLHNNQSFTDTVSCAIMFGGDADSYGALAGAYSGALHGRNGIPQRLYHGVENSGMLEQRARELYQSRYNW